MRRRLVAVGSAAATALSVVAAGCGGPSLQERVDAAEVRVQRLEDRYRDLRSATTRPAAPPTTAPPPTVAPPTTAAPPPTEPPATEPPPTAPAVAIDPAPADAVRAVIGAARWDDALPVPAECIQAAVFEPFGPDGVGGGRITCDLPFAAEDVAAFVRQLNQARSLQSVDGGLQFTYGDIATVVVQPSGAGSRFVAEQRFPFQ